MDLNKEISEVYDEFVKDTFKKENIRIFFLNHERKELFQKNLLKEMKKAFHLLKDIKTIRIIIKDMSKVFCKAALEHKEKELNKSFKPTIIKSDAEEC